MRDPQISVFFGVRQPGCAIKPGVLDVPPRAAPSCPVCLVILSPFQATSPGPPLPFISLFACLPLLPSFAENVG